VPVRQVDGREIGTGTWPLTDRLRALYRQSVERDVAMRRGDG